MLAHLRLTRWETFQAIVTDLRTLVPAVQAINLRPAKIETERLGADPRLVTHTLLAGSEHDQKGMVVERNAKNVLHALTQGDWQRERACLVEPPMQRLRDRGQENGLRQFVDDVAQLLVPQIS